MLINDDVTTVGIDLGGTKLAAAPMKGSIFVESGIIKEATPVARLKILSTLCVRWLKRSRRHTVSQQ